MAILSVTISAGQSLSNHVALGSTSLRLIIAPPVWTPANMTIQISPDAINFYEYSRIGMSTAVMVPCYPSRAYALLDMNWPKAMSVKIRSGSSNAPVIQEAERTFILVVD